VVADRVARTARGEAAGLRWIDLDLDARLLTVERQLVQVGKEVIIGQPKSAASQRTIAIDKATARLLREHEQRQESDRDRCGERWHEAGYVFTWPDGLPLRPDYLTSQFAFLARKAGLPPIRLHDLRHGAASTAQTGRVASDASFGGFSERPLPAPQRIGTAPESRAGLAVTGA
jgi:integrase